MSEETTPTPPEVPVPTPSEALVPPPPQPDAKADSSPGTSGAEKRTLRRLRRPGTGDSSPGMSALPSPTAAAATATASPSPRSPAGSADASRFPGGDRPGPVPVPAPDADPLVGSTIDGKYKVLAPVGRGGMAHVYRAWHVVLGKEFAIKLISPEANESERFRERFFREARIALELVHKHIAQVREFGEAADGRFYILMDFCPGRTFGQLLQDDGPLPPGRVGKIVGQVLDAVAEAHGRQIVHRDLKPDNIMVGDDDHVRLLDFGLARAGDLPAPGESGGFARPRVIGTPRYMSPEQAAGEPSDARSDLYSIGLIVYEAITGKTPFPGDDAAALIRQRIAQDPLPPSVVAPGKVPPALEAVIMRALARERGARWQSAAEMRDALARALEGVLPPAERSAALLDFELQGALEAPLGKGQAQRVRHRPSGREGVLWTFEVGQGDAEGHRRFEALLARARAVEHRALAPIVDGGADGKGRLFVFGGWSPGPTLRDRAREGALPLEAAATLMAPVVQAVARAHASGVAHGAIDARLVTVGQDGPVLHGTGVRAACGEPAEPLADVRALVRLTCALLAGPDAQDDPARARDLGVARGGPSLQAIVEGALADPPAHADAQSLAKALAGVPAFAARLARPPATGTAKRPRPRAAPLFAIAGGVAALAVAGLVGRWAHGRTPGAVVAAVTPGALLRLHGKGDRADVQREARAGEGGRVRFDDLPAGEYVLEVTAADAEPCSEELMVEPGEATATALTGAPLARVEPPAPAPVAPPPATPQDEATRRLADASAREQVQAARGAALDVGAQTVAADALAEADAAWARAEGLTGPPLTQRAGQTVAVYEAVARLATGRTGLVALEGEVAALSSEARAHRAAAIAALVDATAPDALASADRAIEAARAAGRGAPDPATVSLAALEEGRQAWRKAVTAWTTARDELRALDAGAREADPRAAVGKARAAAVAAGAEALAKAELAAADAVATGELDAAAVAAVVAAYEAAGRAATLRREGTEVEALRQAARRDLADVHCREPWDRAEALLVAAKKLPAGDPAAVEAWRGAHEAFTAVATRAHEVNAVKSLVSRFAVAMVHRKDGEVFGCYLDPSVDRAFLTRVLPVASSVRFRVGEPAIEGDVADALVDEFSYADSSKKGERTSHRGLHLRLRRAAGEWRVQHLRRE